jgi:DNA-binding NtrC family response regulator
MIVDFEQWARRRDQSGSLEHIVANFYGTGLDLGELLERVRILYALEALNRSGGNVCAAAVNFGMHRNSLGRILAKNGLDARTVRQAVREAGRRRGGGATEAAPQQSTDSKQLELQP